MPTQRVLSTIDSHTAGHPTRVIVAGLPPLKGSTVTEKYEWFQNNLDDVRTLLLHEPRGHSGMLGAVITESTKADFGAFFLGSYNYLPMCGHATIGIAATLDYQGLITPNENGIATFSLEVPAGIVNVVARYEDGTLAGVGFDNVPSHLAARDISVEASSISLKCDIAYGGNWYALVDAASAGVSLMPSGVHKAMDVGSEIKSELNRKIQAGDIADVDDALHSVLFYQTKRRGAELVSRQLVVLASNKFDRSPCGTGTSARLAQLLQSDEIMPGERIRSSNILDIEFSASAVPIGDGKTQPVLYQPSIEGLAHITGQHTFLIGGSDPLPNGFLCQ